MHDEVAGKADSRIDLNRTGTPLLEIVTHPDLRSPDEAKAYLTELKLLLSYIDVSDCNMQEGSLRVDANVNLHIDDAARAPVATPIVEIKNMNSFRAVERALAYEAERQYEEWRETGKKLGRRAQADSRLGRPGSGDARRSATRRSPATTAIFPIPIWCRCVCDPRRLRRSRARWANCRRALRAAARVRLPDWIPTTRTCWSIRAAPLVDLLRAGRGRVPGSQAGQQLGPAGCAPHAQ